MYIKVKVWTEAGKEKVTRLDEDKFEVRVKEKAERNLANKKMTEVFKNYFSCRKARIVSGHKSRNKVLEIDV